MKHLYRGKIKPWFWGFRTLLPGELKSSEVKRRGERKPAGSFSKGRGTLGRLGLGDVRSAPWGALQGHRVQAPGVSFPF